MSDSWIYLSDKMPEQRTKVWVSHLMQNVNGEYEKHVCVAMWILDSGLAQWYTDSMYEMKSEPYAWQPLLEPADLKGVTVVHVKE